MKIKDIEIKNNIFLAPMAGVTDFAFRSIAREFGAGLSYTEMVSAKGLYYNPQNKVYSSLLKTLDNEKPCCVQIFGNDEEIMAKVCQMPEIQKFDIIDINMGCPATKIVKNCEGSALLKNIDKAVSVARACVNATSKPITCKIRIGFENGANVAVELAKRLEEVGVAAITVHGRTKEQGYSGEVDYATIKAVKEAVNIPVIGNGNITDEASLNRMLETGVDAVMIGRAAMGAPWVFDNFGKDIDNKTKLNAILKHVKLLQTHFDEKHLTAYLRKHFLWYLKDVPNANIYRFSLARLKSLEEAIEQMKDIFGD